MYIYLSIKIAFREQIQCVKTKKECVSIAREKSRVSEREGEKDNREQKLICIDDKLIRLTN